MKKSFISLCAVAALAVPAAAQTVVFSEDFESYADIAAVGAAWTNAPATEYSLNTGAGEGAEGSDQWLSSIPGSGSSFPRPTQTFAPITASDEDPVALSFYVRAENFGNTRTGMSLRDAGSGTNPYVHFGTNNGVNTDHYAFRALGVPGITSGYYYLTEGPNRTAGEWVKLSFQISASALRFFENDVEIVDEARVLTGAPAPFGSINIGYGLPPNQPVDYDSILVEHGANASVNDWDLY